MRKSLLTTVATAAVLGWATLAFAQGTPNAGQSGAGGSLEQQNKGALGGALKGQGNAPINPGGKTLGQSGNKPTTNGPKTLGQSGTPNSGEGAQQRFGQEPPAQGRNEANPRRGAETEHGNTGMNSTGHRGASAELSQQQRSRISTIIGKGHQAHVPSDANISVNVGAVVPRSVHVEVLPPDIVQIVPQYEGYDYVVVGDQILIVDPNTMEIVAVVPA